MTWDQLQDQCPRRGLRRKGAKAVSKTRFPTMGSAEEKRTLMGSVAQDAPVFSRGFRERAPGKGVIGPDITTRSPGNPQADGKRERAPARWLKVSDFPAPLLGKTPNDGKRERAPVKGVMGSDVPMCSVF